MDKLAVAAQFSQAADHYDEAAHLQRNVADRLLALVNRLPVQGQASVADLGTGTGYCLPFLQQRFSPEQLYGLDISSAMLNKAAQRVARVQLVEADLEQPPFEANSLDLATTSLAVQWLEHPEPFVSRMAQALKPGGYLAVATLGPKTLCELKQAWAQVDGSKHVNDFHHAVDWIEAIWQSELTLELWREERLEVRYDSPLELLQELKTLGANHVDRTEKPKGSHVRRMLRVYDGFTRNDGRYPATWDVFYLIARKP
ncbi:malonyl-ACP O-methyltransferase BioC [Reinekea sp. G2M2-21]|uniref:malonyl-ACP O-methyltransferase BioC n=1 Tax=Reinekea sp. G2M2-21 TaxID=2788942 RepID=UPI0018AA6B38